MGDKVAILAKPESFDVPAVSSVVAKFRKIPFQDAVHDVKMSWGLLGQNWEGSEAEKLVDELNSAGIESFSAPSSALINLRAAYAVQRIDLHDEGFDVRVPSGRNKVIPWPYILMISAAAYKETRSKTIKVVEGPSAGAQVARAGIMLATGLPIPIGKKKTIEKKVDETELRFYLDLFLRGNLLRIHIDAQTLDYSFLHEKKGYGAQENFRILVKDLALKASGAMQNRGTRILLEGKPITAMAYETPSDFEQECRWLLTLASLRKT